MFTTSRRTILLLISLLVVCTNMFVPTFHGQAQQTKEREIKKLTWPKEPVKIGKLKAKGAIIVLGEKFNADDDWMKGLKFSVKNTSEKTITYLEIKLNFPRDKGNPKGAQEEPDAHDRIIYGQYPALPGETATPHDDQPPIRPGDTVDVILRDYDGMRDFLNNTHYPASINRLEVSIGDVVFADGTKWSGGGLFRRDTDNPGGWIRIKESTGINKDRNENRYGLLTTENRNSAFTKNTFKEVVPRFIKAGLRPYTATQISQCYGGCGSNYYSQDQYCGTNTRCAVRYDWVSCTWADSKETSVKIQYDRCVNRDTHVACSTFRYTDIKKPCAFLVSTRQECEQSGYSWNYTSNSCEEPTPPPGDGGCTTPQWSDGSCPDGTYPDNGMCCSGGVDCSRTAARASLDVSPSLALPPPDDDGCGGTCVFDPETNSCASPILIDTSGDGFHLTNAAGGVRFDLDSDGTPEQLAWTTEGTDDTWLVLDRDNNGVVENGRELFGNYTPQPAPGVGTQRNGFLALAVYDRRGNGGNADGLIDNRDTIYSALRLWRDANHNGLSETGELHALASLGVATLHLDYKESKRADEYGNGFRYRAKLDDAKGASVNRRAWDVFLVKAP